MKKEFDFDKIGKQIPYKVPPGFFDEITNLTLVKAKVRERKSGIRKIYTVVSVAASLLIIILFSIVLNNKQTEKKSEELVINESVKQEKPVEDSVPARSEKAVITEIEAGETAVIKPETLDNLLAEMTNEELGQLADDLDDELFMDELTND